MSYQKKCKQFLHPAAFACDKLLAEFTIAGQCGRLNSRHADALSADFFTYAGDYYE